MKKLEIIYIEALNELDGLSPAHLLESRTELNAIDRVNWPNNFAYQPAAFFNIARSKNSLFIRFKVVEQNLRAIYTKDQQAVWEDSCVEFFCQIPGSNTYMNFEFNCIGTCVATTRKSKELEIVPFDSEQLEKIERFPSLIHRPFTEKKGLHEWELIVKIPFILLGISTHKLPGKLLGNFYKCADGTATPHYVSWNSIETTEPNFHCPEYFGELCF